MLRIETSDAIRVLLLARPEAGHAISAGLMDALQQAVDEAGADDSIRAMIISGEGQKFFCSGGDLKEFSGISDDATLFRMVRRMGALFRSIVNLRIPVIAAVNGYALGAGAELAIACDIRVFGREASIGFAQASVGVLPTLYSLGRLRALVGQGTASELVLTARTLASKEAFSLGLASSVVLSGTELENAHAVARRLVANCPRAMAAAKRFLAIETLSGSEEEIEERRILPQLWFSEFRRAAERRFAARRQLRRTVHDQ